MYNTHSYSHLFNQPTILQQQQQLDTNNNNSTITTTIKKNRIPNVLVIGVGEYVTGYVHSGESKSDKPIGVVLLTLFDLKRRGKINKILLAGTQGTKFPQIRNHLNNGLKRYNFNNLNHFNNNIQLNNIQLNNNENILNEYLNKTYPNDDIEKDNQAYLKALNELEMGDIVFIFTPDHLHYQMTIDSIKKGMNIYIAKPLVQKLQHHYDIINHINQFNNNLNINNNNNLNNNNLNNLNNLNNNINNNKIILGVEVHKRWDPIYSDARDRILNELGNYSYFQSYMSQPSSQLITFKNWVNDSDINYYLNSHHIDFHSWCLLDLKNTLWRPYKINSTASYGIANNHPFNLNTEDSITLNVQWLNLFDFYNNNNNNLNDELNNNLNENNNNLNDKKLKIPFKLIKEKGTGIYTSSWVAPKESDVHSQQRFMYQGSKGEVIIDQAHRGYTLASQSNQGLKSINPLFMKYSPDVLGVFSGQNGYGYQSLASFIECVYLYQNNFINDLDLLKLQLPSVDFIRPTINTIDTINNNNNNNENENDTINEKIKKLPTHIATLITTAILEAGRISLDRQLEGLSGDVFIQYDKDTLLPIGFEF